MWLMLQQSKADDYVVATGRTISVRAFCRIAFQHVGLAHEEFVGLARDLVRPAEVDLLLGDASHAQTILGWKARTQVEALAAEMVDADIDRHHKRLAA